VRRDAFRQGRLNDHLEIRSSGIARAGSPTTRPLFPALPEAAAALFRPALVWFGMKPPALLKIHRWIALVFAPLLLIQALTGTALLFREPLARLIDPAAMIRQTPATQNAAPSALVGAAQERFAGFHVTRLYLPLGADDTAFAQLSDGGGQTRYAAIDPGSAQVLAAGPIWRFPLEAALQIHFRLLGDWRGIAIVALNGIALFLIGCSGVWHWWPGRGRVITSLKVRKTLPGRIKLRLYHRSTGAVAFMLILLSSTTGAAIAINELSFALPAPAAPERAPLTDAQIDGTVDLVQARFREARIRDIRMAPDGMLAVSFFTRQPDAGTADLARVDAPAARLTAFVPAAENPSLTLKLLPFHSGDILGLPGQLLLLAEAAALIFLAISGPLSWWRARKPRSGAKR
jgi:uncharacterized iron-regulated membrane protein